VSTSLSASETIRRSALPVVIVVLAVGGASARSAPAATAGGRIVFEAQRVTRVGGLVVMDADGSHRTHVGDVHSGSGLAVGRDAYAYGRVIAGVYVHTIVTDSHGTRDLGDGTPAAFSPDGKTVVIQARDASWELRDRATGALGASFPATMRFVGWSAAGLLWERNLDVVVTQPDGSGEVTVGQYDGEGLVGVMWSPDGAWISYPARPDPAKPPELHVVHPDGTDDHVISAVYPETPAVWSPDGTRLAFASPDAHLELATPAGAVHDTGAIVADNVDRLGSWSPDGTRFAFVPARPDFKSGPLTLISTTTGVTRVVTTTAAEDAAWSPDGRTLLLKTEDGIAVVPASAPAAKAKLLARSTQQSAWLPNGQLIVYQNELDGEQLATVSPTGGRPRFIPGTENDLEPAWSPDGTKLAFASQNEDSSIWTIAIANADGTHRRVLARSDANEPSPSWSPDGRFIAYATYSGVEVIPSAGGRPRRIARAELAWTVAWSPDGSRIAFGNVTADSDFANVVVVAPDGSHRRTVVNGEAGENWGGIAWSPDGRTLAVARRSDEGGDPDGVADLYLLRLNTGGKIDLGLDIASPSFSPDGRQLAVAIDDGTVAVLDLKTGHERTVGTGDHPSWAA
jgi:Tol biopolymer transport system component